MRKTNISEVPVTDRLLISIPDFAGYCSCGRFTAEKIAADAQAVVFIGSRKFVNVEKARRYLSIVAE